MLIFLIICILSISSIFILVSNLLKIKQDLVQSISLISTICCFFISLFFWILFDRSTSQNQFSLSSDLLLNSFRFFHQLSIDGISLFFVLLTTFIIPLCLLSSYKKNLSRINNYCLSFLFLELFLLLSFLANDLIVFFFFFESTLIPMFFLIGI